MSNFHKMFNSQTITGRANVAKATYASFAVLYVMHRLRKRSKATPPAAAKSVTEDISTTSTREVVGDIKANTESAGEVRATSSEDFGGEEVLNKGSAVYNKNAKKVHLREHEPSVVNAVWGCDD